MAFGYITADQVLPDGSSTAEVWESWYDLIPGSKQTKNAIWLQAWSKWASADANTSSLREYMKKNAGIEITTDGIGSVIDATKSAVDSIEDFAMMPIYLLMGGAAVIIGLGGFMVYEGIKNPEAAGSFVGSAGKAVMLKDGGSIASTNTQQYWLYGATGLTTTVLMMLFYVRNQNQLVVNNIMAALVTKEDPVTDPGLGGSGAKKNLTDLNNSNIFVPSWWQTAPDKVTISVGDGTGLAAQYADRIYNAKANVFKFSFTDYPEDVVAVFKNLKTKQDVSKLADVFEAKYKTPLLTWLTENNVPWMTGGCSPTQDTCYLGSQTNYMKQIYDWITNHLT